MSELKPLIAKVADGKPLIARRGPHRLQRADVG